MLHMSEADTDLRGLFVLDSGAHPTHTPHPLPCIQLLHNNLQMPTATQQQTRCTHLGKMRLPTAKNRTLCAHAVAKKHIRHNILSVHNMTSQYRLVAFTATQRCIIKARGTLLTVTATVPWRSNQYELKDRVAHH